MPRQQSSALMAEHDAIVEQCFEFRTVLETAEQRGEAVNAEKCNDIKT